MKKQQSSNFFMKALQQNDPEAANKEQCVSENNSNMIHSQITQLYNNPQTNSCLLPRLPSFKVLQIRSTAKNDLETNSPQINLKNEQDISATKCENSHPDDPKIDLTSIRHNPNRATTFTQKEEVKLEIREQQLQDESFKRLQAPSAPGQKVDEGKRSEDSLPKLGPPPIVPKKKNRPLLSSYMVIPDERRYQLIKYVIFENIRVKDAAGALGINYQTAKSILRRYHLTGEITSCLNSSAAKGQTHRILDCLNTWNILSNKIA
ncbi:hypothetical protein FGO68_gene9911 [Halteria grandinella]|uniref:Uncharacterized protein n=1 Tax=Halteria grandinella TaxID=5974 RepID=A0A8J8P605_HALGN|nr:hypothetical protein FGO68_gene9911 [Halteria grandinella]